MKIDVSELIGARGSEQRVRIDVASASFTPEIRTDDGLCILRILSPADRADTFECYELTIAPGGALESNPHVRGTREHLTVLEGSLDVVAANEVQPLPLGATARYPADVAHIIRNISDQQARALLVMILIPGYWTRDPLYHTFSAGMEDRAMRAFYKRIENELADIAEQGLMKHERVTSNR